jgi:hypothetical protein
MRVVDQVHRYTLPIPNIIIIHIIHTIHPLLSMRLVNRNPSLEQSSI